MPDRGRLSPRLSREQDGVVWGVQVGINGLKNVRILLGESGRQAHEFRHRAFASGCGELQGQGVGDTVRYRWWGCGVRQRHTLPPI